MVLLKSATSQTKEKKKMAKFSADSKMKDLLNDPGATAILEEYLPGISKTPTIKMAYAMTFKKVAAFPQTNVNKEQLAEIDQKLQALG